MYIQLAVQAFLFNRPDIFIDSCQRRLIFDINAQFRHKQLKRYAYVSGHSHVAQKKDVLSINEGDELVLQLFSSPRGGRVRRRLDIGFLLYIRSFVTYGDINLLTSARVSTSSRKLES